MRKRIGLDLDGVLIDHIAHKQRVAEQFGITLEPWQANSNLIKQILSESERNTLQNKVYAELTRQAPPVPGALEHIGDINGDLYIISARRSSNIRYAQEWLLKHGVFDFVPAERIFFCDSGKDKRAICDRLGISAYVDDQYSVLQHLSARSKRIMLDSEGISHHLNMEEGFYVAEAWEHIPQLIG